MDAEVHLAHKARARYVLLGRVDDGVLVDLLHRPALVEEEVRPEDRQDEEVSQVEVREERKDDRSEPVVALRRVSGKNHRCKSGTRRTSIMSARPVSSSPTDSRACIAGGAGCWRRWE